MSIRRMSSRLANGALLLSVVGGLAAFACSDSRPTASQGRVVSVLVLESINGSLPGVLSQDPARKIEILADTITLSTDNTYSRQASVRTTDLGVSRSEAVEQRGRYTTAGSTITISFDRSEDMILEREGNRLRGIAGGRVLIYVVR